MIHEQITKIMSEIGAVGKNQKNTTQNYKFRGIDTVYNEIHGLLAKHEVFTVPEVISERSEERESKNKSALIYRILTIRYHFYAKDGSTLAATVIGEGMDSGDKASNKAMSVAHKYALLQVFCVPTDEKKDPENDSHDVAPKKTASVEPVDLVRSEIEAGIEHGLFSQKEIDNLIEKEYKANSIYKLTKTQLREILVYIRGKK